VGGNGAACSLVSLPLGRKARREQRERMLRAHYHGAAPCCDLIGSGDVAHPKMRLAMREPAPYITCVTELTGVANGFREIA